MSSVNDILAERNKAPKSAGTPAATKAAAKQQTAELAKDLQAEGIINNNGTAPVTPPPKPARGRPRTNSNGSKTPPRSKSPNVTLPDEFPQQHQTDPSVVAQRLKCKQLISKLRSYHRHFPELLGAELNAVNPHLCTFEQLQELIESCREVIKFEVESLATGNIAEQFLDGLETTAMQVAASSESEWAQKLVLLRNLKQACMEDQAIMLDMKLIACEFSGFMPNSPYVRLGINICRVAAEVIKTNFATSMNNSVAGESRFSEL